MSLIICGNLIVKNGKFLLVRETKKRVAGLYNFPAGQLKKDENVVTAAVREAKEETGLRVRPIKLVSIFEHFLLKTKTKVVIFIFESRIIGGKVTPSKTHPEVRFCSLSEIEKFQRKGLLRGKHILKVIQNWRRGQLYPINIIEPLN